MSFIKRLSIRERKRRGYSKVTIASRQFARVLLIDRPINPISINASTTCSFSLHPFFFPTSRLSIYSIRRRFDFYTYTLLLFKDIFFLFFFFLFECILILKIDPAINYYRNIVRSFFECSEYTSLSIIDYWTIHQTERQWACKSPVDLPGPLMFYPDNNGFLICFKQREIHRRTGLLIYVESDECFADSFVHWEGIRLVFAVIVLFIYQ